MEECLFSSEKKIGMAFFYTLYHKTNGRGDKPNIKHVYGYGTYIYNIYSSI